MRRMKQGMALGAVLSLGFGLTACGGDDGGSGAESGTSLTIWADERRAGPIGDLAVSWGEENGVNVEVVQINFNDLKNQFAQQAPAGQGPDILLGDLQWTGEFSASGLVAPINLGANKDNFNEASVGVGTVDGQVFGLPVATENIILFRNTNLAPNKPASINEMAETGLALQAEGKTQYPIAVNVTTTGDAYHSYPFLSAAGGYFFEGPDADGNYDLNSLGLTSEGGLAFAKAWSDLGKQGVIRTTFVNPDLISAWSAGTLPYWITGPWHSEVVTDAAAAGVPFAVEAIPGWEGIDNPAKPIVGAQGFMLNQNSNNKSTAQAFLDATMNTEFMDAIFEADPRPPAWTESAETASSDPIIKAILEFGEGGMPNLSAPAMGVMFEEAGLQQAAILDGADPVATTEAAETAAANRIGTGS